MAAPTLVGVETATASGPYGAGGGEINSITIDYPAGIAALDCLHVAVCLPRYRWRQAVGTSGILIARQYGLTIPTGWQLVQSYAFNSQYEVAREAIVFLLRRFVTGAEGASLTLNLTRTDFRPSTPVDGEVLQVLGVMSAHRNVAVSTPVNLGPVFAVGIDGYWGNGATVTTESMLAQFSFGMAYGDDPPDVGDPVPAFDDPLATSSTPSSWDVGAQESATAVRATTLYTSLAEVQGEENYVGRVMYADATSFTSAPLQYGEAPVISGASPKFYRIAFALTSADQAPSVDAPPAPGQVGVTGSGSLTPEWIGRDREVRTPLRTSVWGPTIGSSGPELGLVLGEADSPQALALEATLNGLGACTTATALFAADPGLTPYQQVLRFGLLTMTEADADPSTIWWSGVVRNVRYDNGLYAVDLDGLWALLNDARVQLDSGGDIDRPSLPGVIDDTLVLGIGDPTAIVLETDADEQQTWGDHLNNVFRAFPRAAWGVGPDLTFVQGLPEQGGVQELDADSNASVSRVTAGEFILPPYVTEWWALTSAGAVVSAQLTPSPGLLVPARIMQARVDDSDNLLTPKEAEYPIFDGPTYELEYAGLAVPPLQVLNLAGGVSQFVASARVRVSLGEEGSMPRLSTLLTTVALPYEGGR